MKKEKEKNGLGKAYWLNHIVPPVNDLVSQSSPFILNMHLPPHLQFLKKTNECHPKYTIHSELFTVKKDILPSFLKARYLYISLPI
jgi:hypothetical protein